MLQDMIQFGTIFLVFFISFYFTLRGEVRSTDTQLRMPFSANGSFGNESNMTTSETGTLNTSLDIFPFETQIVLIQVRHVAVSLLFTCREFYNVLFTGLRVMVEGGSIVDQYFGPWGFR